MCAFHTNSLGLERPLELKSYMNKIVNVNNGFMYIIPHSTKIVINLNVNDEVYFEVD